MKYNSYNLGMKKAPLFYNDESVHIFFKEGTILDVLFADGSIKRYDVMSAVDVYPPYIKLKDRKLFLKGKNYFDGIVWNKEIDMATEPIYYEGEDVTKEYQDVDYQQYLVGFKLFAKRRAKNMSQKTLSKRTGIDQATISKIEKGTMNPSVKIIMKIVRALDAEVELIIK